MSAIPDAEEMDIVVTPDPLPILAPPQEPENAISSVTVPPPAVSANGSTVATMKKPQRKQKKPAAKLPKQPTQVCLLIR